MIIAEIRWSHKAYACFILIDGILSRTGWLSNISGLLILDILQFSSKVKSTIIANTNYFGNTG